MSCALLFVLLTLCADVMGTHSLGKLPLPKFWDFFNAVGTIFLIFVHKHEQGIQEIPYLDKMGQEFRKFAVIALLWLYWPHSVFQFFLLLRQKILKVLHPF